MLSLVNACSGNCFLQLLTIMVQPIWCRFDTPWNNQKMHGLDATIGVEVAVFE